jgi:recombination protein RecT
MRTQTPPRPPEAKTAVAVQTTPLDAVAKMPNEKITTRVLGQIDALVNQGRLVLPPDYNAANALNSAWLKFQTIENRGKRPLIEKGQVTDIVTLSSVVNCLHDMVVQGLNCAKNQCYFIIYGDQLTCQRSYFGDMLVAARSRPGIDFYFNVVREGDNFQPTMIRNKDGLWIETLKIHDPMWPKKGAITGAYCGIIAEDGSDLGMVLFDIERIKKSWAKSKTYRQFGQTQDGEVTELLSGDTPHWDYADEMCLRTVIRRRCKPIINASGDEMLKAAIRRQDEDAIEAEINEEARMYANGQTLSIPARAESVVAIPQPPQAREPVTVNAVPAERIGAAPSNGHLDDEDY